MQTDDQIEIWRKLAQEASDCPWDRTSAEVLRLAEALERACDELQELDENFREARKYNQFADEEHAEITTERDALRAELADAKQQNQNWRNLVEAFDWWADQSNRLVNGLPSTPEARAYMAEALEQWRVK